MRWLRKEVLCEHLLFCLSGGVPAGRLLHCTQGAAAGGAFGQHSAGVWVRGLTAGICSGLFCGGTGFPAACPFVGRSCCGRAGRLVGAARHAVHPCTGSGRRRSVGLCAALGCCYPVPAAHPCAASGRRQLSHRAKLLWRYGDAPGIPQNPCRYRHAARAKLAWLFGCSLWAAGSGLCISLAAPRRLPASLPGFTPPPPTTLPKTSFGSTPSWIC